MNRRRISILGLMGIVLVTGLLFAFVRAERGIVRSGLEGWANAARYLSASVLVIATYCARYRKGSEADWWFGFALGGWSYYLFSGDMIWHWDGPNLMPSSLVRSLPQWIMNLVAGKWMNKIMSYSSVSIPETWSHLLRIVQALLVLFAALVGGSVCSVLSWRRRNHSPRIDSSRRP